MDNVAFQNITIGSDVEVFLQLEGKPVSAVGIIPGEKDTPVQFQPGHGLLRDNVMAEFFTPICFLKDPQTFLEALNNCLEHLQTVIPTGFSLGITPSMEFPEEELANEEACTFGCSPFIDIYKNFTRKSKVDDESIYANDVGNFRFAGGHIHFGWEGANRGIDPDGIIEDKAEVLKKMFFAAACDKFLYKPSLQEDTDDIRRQYYGKPGKVRFKPYGLEYRSLSNYWVRSQGQMETILERITQMIEWVNSIDPGDYLQQIIEIQAELIGPAVPVQVTVEQII